jgi:hypothetical protein
MGRARKPGMAGHNLPRRFLRLLQRRPDPQVLPGDPGWLLGDRTGQRGRNRSTAHGVRLGPLISYRPLSSQHLLSRHVSPSHTSHLVLRDEVGQQKYERNSETQNPTHHADLTMIHEDRELRAGPARLHPTHRSRLLQAHHPTNGDDRCRRCRIWWGRPCQQLVRPPAGDASPACTGADGLRCGLAGRALPR